MLTRGPRLKARTAAVVLLLGILVVALFLSAIPAGRADAPIVITNPDASRTVTWTFGAPDSLTLQNVELVGGQAVLPWQAETVAWTSPGQFLANASRNVNMSSGANGLELRSDSTNHVANGAFGSASNWTFASGPTGQVTATREAASQDAIFAYNTGADWDTFDQLTGWSWNSPPSTVGGISLETVNKVQGVGSMDMTLNISSGASWVSALHTGAVNWSAWDHLVVWINATDVNPPLSFNITAMVGVSPRTTPAIPLTQGWNEVAVDLTGLGNAQERQSLQDLRFRVNGLNVPTTRLYFDYATLGTAHTLDESAAITQPITKSIPTTAAPGSGYLSFDWSWVNVSGVVSASASASLSGSGTVDVAFGHGSPGTWQHFGADVSSVSAGTGSYTLSFQLRVVVDNVSASHVNLRLDNVSLEWPNRGNGTFESIAIPLALSSKFDNVTWGATVPGGTLAAFRLRSGNGTDPSAASWSPWQTWIGGGHYIASLPGADHFQIRIDFNTTNASLSPTLSSALLDVRHRAPSGTITSDIFTPSADFLRWRSFNATWAGASGTALAFLAGDGSSLAPVPPSGSLAAVQGRTLRWRADLSTLDGLKTPGLVSIRATYEFLGPADHVQLTWSPSLDVEVGQSIAFSASVVDAGGHPLNASIIWSTTDRLGHVDNSGTYVAGSLGTWFVNATVAGSGQFASARVNVQPMNLLQAALYPYGLVAAIILGGAYTGYEVWVRRAFAIDDVFLISKEGRLMIHNTRRMRADRDEDILSAMLTAILSFLMDFDREENGDLRRFQLGGKTALLQRGKNAYLAAVYSGRVPRWSEKDLRRFMDDLERRFGKVFAQWSGDPHDLQGLKEFSDRFVSRLRYRPTREGRGRAS
jgi:hypothetical protein